LYIVLLVFTLASGIGIWRAFNHAYPQFEYVTCLQPYSNAWTFEFRSPPSQTANVDFFVDYTSAEQTHRLVDSHWESEFVERGNKFDENGVKIGERGVTVFRSDGEIKSAKIFWTEGDVFWSINAPTVELAEAFENSYAFGMARSGLPIPSR